MSTYVYGFTHSTHPLPVDGLPGVGPSGSPLRIVRHDGLAAVVSDAPEDLRAKRRDLETHQRILETLLASGAVLPMRFGTVSPDDDAVRTELAARAGTYKVILSRVDGKVELNVKGGYATDAVLREVLAADEALRARNNELRSRGGGSYEERVACGESLAAAVDDRRSRDADRVVRGLAAHATEVSVGPPLDGGFVNVSFLVDATARPGFDDAFIRLEQELAPTGRLSVYGPLPAYSFVALEPATD